MKPQSLFSPVLPPTAGGNAIGQSATAANSFCDLCLQLMSAWFTLLFKALQSESGSVKFVAQVFCLPRLSSARELANTFVRPACACVCATCLALATCHLARLRHRTSMPASTHCSFVCVCVCACARVLTANKFCFRFLHEKKTSQADRADYFLSWSPLPVSDASAAGVWQPLELQHRLRVLPVPAQSPLPKSALASALSCLRDLNRCRRA